MSDRSLDIWRFFSFMHNPFDIQAVADQEDRKALTACPWRRQDYTRYEEAA